MTIAQLLREGQSEVVTKLESDALDILRFMASNKLLANESKTTFMMFGRRNKVEPAKIRVGYAEVKEQEAQKILGITVTSDLKWNAHINNLKSKLLHRLYLMRHLRSLLPLHTLKQIADGLFNSQIRYGLPLFLRPRLHASAPTSSHLYELQVIHNELVRLIVGVNRRDKVNMAELRESHHIMSINQMLCQATAIETFKVTHHDSVPSLKNMLTETGTSSIITRSRSNALLRTPLRTTRVAEGFATHASKLFNMLPMALRENQSYSSFKSKLNKWITDHLQ